MRLLNVDTLQLQEFYDHNVPDYAILSHTWQEEEATLQDLANPASATKKGFSKIRSCCAQAIRDGYKWIWVDTCCIDKTSSAELSEAINSMFRWYQQSSVCYAYLEDLPPQSPGDLDQRRFMSSKWFTRGWTLQELIAPGLVEFYDQSWNEIGTKLSLCDLIHQTTGIRHEILSGHLSLDSVSAAERMSWAATRNTSRLEDIAYCLLGLFDIHMPLLYGEGTRAFNRLQQEIIRSTEDLSILLWASYEPTSQAPGVLASTLLRFST
ncbi:HET domain containing protein [Colletotrichum tofieldiae]|nr:HET domain containing protein [Colletotrichum tofieldiae]GKT75001.1 HET domain containing protein [Colletotrichum tofieldiae]